MDQGRSVGIDIINGNTLAGGQKWIPWRGCSGNVVSDGSRKLAIGTSGIGELSGIGEHGC